MPCAHENRQHTRQVLEILLTRLNISGKVCKKQGRDVITFQIIKGTCPLRTCRKPTQASQLSQLSFQDEMLIFQYMRLIFRNVPFTSLIHLIPNKFEVPCKQTLHRYQVIITLHVCNRNNFILFEMLKYACLDCRFLQWTQVVTFHSCTGRRACIIGSVPTILRVS